MSSFASDDSLQSDEQQPSTVVGLPPKQTKPVNYNRLLTKFFAKHDSKLIPKVDKLLKQHKGKEAKYMLMLAKKYNCSNPLNTIFVSRVKDHHFESTYSLTTFYLQTYYPQDVDSAHTLVEDYKGKEEELFKNLSSNFEAINPLKMERPIDYKKILTKFYEEHDPDKVSEVEKELSECKGKEAILFSVYALKYNSTNALNDVFKERVKDATDIKDHLSLLKRYLSVFHPLVVSNAKSLLLKYKGKEDELFDMLSTKFRAINPAEMEIWADIGKGSLDTIGEEGKSVDKIQPAVTAGSPIQRKSTRRMTARSPAVTP